MAYISVRSIWSKHFRLLKIRFLKLFIYFYNHYLLGIKILSLSGQGCKENSTKILTLEHFVLSAEIDNYNMFKLVKFSKETRLAQKVKFSLSSRSEPV